MQELKQKNNTADRELLITRLLNAPRELVFEVWTNPEHIKHWWGPIGFTNTISKMDVKTNGEWNFIMHGPDGRNYDNKIVFLEIVKPSLIRYRHMTFPYFNATVNFQAQNNKTLLTMCMLFETKEELQKTVEVFKADVGLVQTIGKLEEYLQNTKQSLSNGNPLIMNDTTFIIERTYTAPPELVWQAISDKDHMKKWYFDLAAFEATPGFEFEFSAGEEGKEYLHHCKVTEAIPGKKLAYTWRYVGYEGDSLVTFELFPEGDKTRVRLTHEGLETFPASNPDLAKENFAIGWNSIIGESLKNYVESLQVAA